MDFIDICMGRYQQTYTGRYLKKLPTPLFNPENEQEPAIPFDYEYVDATTRTYKQLISNMTETDGITAVIKTREHLDFKIGAFVSLMDGKLCAITGISDDRTNANIEAARFLNLPFGVEYILRLTEYENPRGI